MFLGILILLMTLLAFLHFIVDGIISPSEQMLVRTRLLKDAEELEDMERAAEGELKQHVRRLRFSYHNLVNEMPRFDLWTFASVKAKFDGDPKFRAAAIKRVQDFEAIADEGLKPYRLKVVRYGDRILFWNTVGWSLYVLPIAVCAALFEKVQNGIKAIITLPPSKLDEIEHRAA